MSAVRTTGPTFRGSCLPRGDIPSSNVTIGVVSFNGVKDELYQVGGVHTHDLLKGVLGMVLIWSGGGGGGGGGPIRN